MKLRNVMCLFIVLAAATVLATRLTAHDGDHGSTQNVADEIRERLRGIDGRLSKAGSLIAQLADSPTAATGAPSGQFVTSMRALENEMRRLQNVADDVMNESGIHDRAAAMSALEKASRDLERMSSSLESMAKNVGQMRKEASRVAPR